MVCRILLFLCIVGQLEAQPYFEWAKRIGGNTDDSGNGITTDLPGNVYTIGSFNGLADFDPGPATVTITGQNDVFISKLNATGNFVWAKTFTGQGTDVGRAICSDSLGNIYTTGTFQGVVDFDPGPASYTLASAWGDDVFISKLDSSGNFMWAKSMGGTSNEVGTSLAVDKYGNIYVVGIFYGTADFDPGPGTYTMSCSGTSAMFISKLDYTGAFVWAESIGGGASYTMGNSITLDKFDNIYTTGCFNGTLDFDPGQGVYNLTTYNNNSDNSFILKLNSSGDFIWAKELWGTNSMGNSIAVDQSGYVYTTGYFSGTVDFDPNGGIVYLSAVPFAGEAFVSKLDQLGNFIWAKKVGGKNNEDGFSISVDLAGRVYVAGSFNDTVDFNPGAGIDNLVSSGASDVFILVLDNLGQFVTAKKIGGFVVDFPLSLSVDVNGNVYTAGSFGGTANFNTDGGTFNLVSAGNSDAFIHKMSGSVLGIEETTGDPTLQVYPNPNGGEFFIVSPCSGILSVKNNLGENVKCDVLITEKTNLVDLKHISKGIYFLYFTGKNFSTIKKIVIE